MRGGQARELAREAKRETVPVKLSISGNDLMIETGAVARDSDVLLAIAEDHQASQVTAGENRGRQLRHVSVLQSLRKVGTIRKGALFSRQVTLGTGAAGKRLIVFLQESNLGRVSGAGLLVP